MIELSLDIVAAFDRIYQKAISSQVAIAVFVVSGKARETPINTDLYREVSATMPEKLVGVYSRTISREWLMQDLQEAEREMCHEYQQRL